MNTSRQKRQSFSAARSRVRSARWAALLLGALQSLDAQSTFQETFTGTSAYGWTFGANPGDTQPALTANTVDTPGSGWLRLNTNTNNQSTFALLDTEIFSVGAQIQIEMEYAFYNGTGADGITFFLVDGDVTASSFTPGAYGGSMGYANRTGEAGMDGGYLGFALDTWGNYSNNNEGRIGGVAGPGSSPVDTTLRPNRVVVRGPDTGNPTTSWAYINSSANLNTVDFNGAASGGTGQSMSFYGSGTRPDQTGADYRSFRLTLDAANQLVVEMKFGTSNEYVTVFESDLSSYARPDTFKVGFTGATGGNTGIHEIRNLSVVSTPNATLGGSYEWDDGKASADDDWGTLAGGESNTNWYASLNANNNLTPLRDSDIFFRSRPATTSAGAAARPSPYASVQTVNVNTGVEVRSLNFNSKYDYQLSGSTITLGDTTLSGTPSINVTDSIANPRFHSIANALTVVENLLVANESHSTLTLGGAMNLGANTLTTFGAGQTNFNGVITGSGPLIANGIAPNGRDSTGIVTLNADNGTSYTGAITINGGQVVALHNNALGNTAAGTTVNTDGTLTFRGGITTSEPITIKGAGTALSEIWDAGAIYNDGGNNILNGAVTLSGDAIIRSRAGNLTLNGAVGQTGGTHSLTKTGDGVLTLNADNTYTGETRIQGGSLRVGNANQINGSDLVLNGGVLELTGDLDTGNAADFTRGVGTTAGDDVRWTGDGGFSASGGNRTVNLGPGSALTWGSGGFVGTGNALLLSSVNADSTVTLSNAINLNGATREVKVAQGSATVDGILSGALTNGGLTKSGDGTLQLSGTNTYAGATVIQGGALRGTISSSSNIQLNGGVLELGSNYTSALGAGAGQIQWTGGGGLAALSGTQTFNVNNNGETTTLTWASGSFVANSQALVLGSTSSAGTLVMANSIALGGAARTIRMQNGSADIDAQLNGNLTGSAGSSLRVEGSGTLAFNRNDSGFDRALTVDGAEFRMTGTADLNSMTALTVQGGGLFTIDNGTSNDNSRIGNSMGVTLNAGNLSYLGNGSNNSTETIGTISLSTGANSINVARAGTQTATLTSASLSRTAGATLDVTRPDTSSSLVFSSAPSLDDGILAYTTVNGTAFATHGAGGISAAAAPDTVGWTASQNVGVSFNTAFGLATLDREVNSVVIYNGAEMDIAGRNLDIQSGGLLAHGASATSFTGGGTLTSSSGELITHVYGTGGFTIQQAITNSGSTSVALTKSGTGTLTLSGSTSNTYTGVTTVNAGTLQLNKSGGATAVAGNLTIGDTSGTDTVKILANEQIADTATVTLRGGTLLNNNNQAVLEIGNSLETFSTLNVTGNSVIDFSGGSPSAPSFLVIDILTIASDAVLTVRNWIDAADYFLVKKSGLDSSGEQANIARIVFDGYGAATWEDYSSEYFMITPHASPVPEPAAYGLLSLGGLAAYASLRRRRR